MTDKRKKVRITNNGIFSENGELIPISYEELLNECITGTYEQLSVIDIVSEAIYNLTGYYLIKYKYNETTFYRKLQRDIRLSEQYKEKYDKFVKADSERRQKIWEETRVEKIVNAQYIEYTISLNRKFKRRKHLRG